MTTDAWMKLKSDPLFVIGTVLGGFLLLLIIAGPWLTAHNPQDMDFIPFAPPSTRHWLGVNDGGMDILAGLVAGAGNTLIFGLTVGAAALLLGVILGLFCAWQGGILDHLLMRLADILLAVPSILVLILAAAFFRPSPIILGLLLAAMIWPTTAKGIRAHALAVKSNLHIRAARHMGASPFYIIRRHLLPELFPLYLVSFAAKVRMALSMEASLGFLGLFDPARASLGMMINDGLRFYYLDVWRNWLLPPILILALLIMAVTFLALSLEKAFDPRLEEF